MSQVHPEARSAGRSTVQHLLSSAGRRDRVGVEKALADLRSASASTTGSRYKLLDRIDRDELFLQEAGDCYVGWMRGDEPKLDVRSAADMIATAGREIAADLGRDFPIILLLVDENVAFPVKSGEAPSFCVIYFPDLPLSEGGGLLVHEVTHCILECGIPLLDEGLALLYQRRYSGSAELFTGDRTVPPKDLRPGEANIIALLNSSRRQPVFDLPFAGGMSGLYGIAEKTVGLLMARLGPTGVAALFDELRRTPVLRRCDVIEARSGLSLAEIQVMACGSAPSDADCRSAATCAALSEALERIWNDPGDSSGRRLFQKEAGELLAARLDSERAGLLARWMCLEAIIGVVSGKPAPTVMVALRHLRDYLAYDDAEGYCSLIASAVVAAGESLSSRTIGDPVRLGEARRAFRRAAEMSRDPLEPILLWSLVERCIPLNLGGGKVLEEFLRQAPTARPAKATELPATYQHLFRMVSEAKPT